METTADGPSTVATPLPSSTTLSATTNPPSLADTWVFEPEQFGAPFAIPEPLEAMQASGDFSFVEFIFGSGVDVSRNLVVTTSGPSSVQAWLDNLASQSGATTTEPIDINVGGISGISVDVEVSPEDMSNSCGYACLVLFGYTWGHELEQGGTARRLLLLHVHGETVAIFANASIENFADLWGEVENLLQDLVWLGP